MRISENLNGWEYIGDTDLHRLDVRCYAWLCGTASIYRTEFRGEFYYKARFVPMGSNEAHTYEALSGVYKYFCMDCQVMHYFSIRVGTYYMRLP